MLVIEHGAPFLETSNVNAYIHLYNLYVYMMYVTLYTDPGWQEPPPRTDTMKCTHSYIVHKGYLACPSPLDVDGGLETIYSLQSYRPGSYLRVLQEI